MVNESARAQYKSIKAVFGIQAFNSIEQAANHIVTAGSLPARKYDTYVHFGMCRRFTFNKFYERKAVGVGEQFLDFFLVAHTLCRFTLFYFHIAS